MKKTVRVGLALGIVGVAGIIVYAATRSSGAEAPPVTPPSIFKFKVGDVILLPGGTSFYTITGLLQPDADFPMGAYAMSTVGGTTVWSRQYESSMSLV